MNMTDVYDVSITVKHRETSYPKLWAVAKMVFAILYVMQHLMIWKMDCACSFHPQSPNGDWIDENFCILLQKCVPECTIDDKPALVKIMAWRRPGDKPLSEAMMISLPTHICVTRPQWVNAVKQLSGVTMKLVLSSCLLYVRYWKTSKEDISRLQTD